MHVRKCRREDVPRAVELARSISLDYPGMEDDPLWVAEDGGRIIGLVALKAHSDCLELCSLGVDSECRARGVGRALAEALMAEAPGDVYLATIIPRFFESCGFERASRIPEAFLRKRTTSWCEGCPRELCTVMVRKRA